MKRPSPLARRLEKLADALENARIDCMSEAEFLAETRAQWDAETPDFRARFPALGRRLEREEKALKAQTDDDE